MEETYISINKKLVIKIAFITSVFALLSLSAVSATILDESVNQNKINTQNQYISDIQTNDINNKTNANINANNNINDVSNLNINDVNNLNINNVNNLNDISRNDSDSNTDNYDNSDNYNDINDSVNSVNPIIFKLSSSGNVATSSEISSNAASTGYDSSIDTAVANNNDINNNYNSKNNIINNNNINKAFKTVTVKNISNLKAAAGETKNTTVTKPKTLSHSSILASATSVSKYVKKNNKLPNYVTISGYNLSMTEFLYLLTKTTENTYKNKKTSVTVKYDIKNPVKASGSNIKNYFYKTDYYDVAKRVSAFIVKNNQVPNFATTKVGKIQYQTLIYTYSQILSYYNQYKKLPTKHYVNIKSSSAINKNLPKYTRISKPIIDDSIDNGVNNSTNDTGANNNTNTDSNSSINPGTSSSEIKSIPTNRVNTLYKNSDGNKSKYLETSANCQVSDSYIKSLSNNITKGHKTTFGKAKAIFNWVRDNVGYSFYYDTKYGAKKT
ncbi:MAG: hypothetical protein ACRC1M_05455, partial [Methanobacteriaceae archaeon]